MRVAVSFRARQPTSLKKLLSFRFPLLEARKSQAGLPWIPPRMLRMSHGEFRCARTFRAQRPEIPRMNRYAVVRASVAWRKAKWIDRAPKSQRKRCARKRWARRFRWGRAVLRSFALLSVARMILAQELCSKRRSCFAKESGREWLVVTSGGRTQGASTPARRRRSPASAPAG